MSVQNLQESDEKTYNEDIFLMEHEGGDLLRKFDLPVIDGKLAKSTDEAIKIGKELGYPLVLKGMSRQIIHKSEAGIVKLNIENEKELIHAYEVVKNNANKYDENAIIEGVLVQKMAPQGIELIIGVKKDNIFGHQLIIGIGGTLVEIIKDFTLAMLPVEDHEIEPMIKKLNGYKMLKGYRGEKGLNIEILKSIIRGINKVVRSKPEISEMDLNPVIFNNHDAFICDVRILIEKDNLKESENSPKKSIKNIGKMLNPSSIAVVGASANVKKNGGRLFRFIVENGYTGDLYPVNPTAKEINGYKAYSSLTDIPGNIDLVCIIVSSKIVPSIIKECIEKDVKTAIIHSSGFSEIGDEGEKLQAEVDLLLEKENIRILGPNSMGIASPPLNIYAAFGSALLSKNRPKGNIGFVSQSGAMGSALLSRAWEQGTGFSRWISVANESDLTISDFIKFMAEDSLTKVITVFMEGLKDADQFKKATLKALHNKKPVLIYKTGKSEVGKRAVQSHTGSITGDDNVYSTAFEKLGVLRMKGIEDMLDSSRAFEIQPIPNGNRIGVITSSGGACSVIADLCEEKGLAVPLLKESKETIKNIIPPFGSAENPVDLTAEALGNPEMFNDVLNAVINERQIDGLIVMLTSNADPGAYIIAEAILKIFKKHDKPIVVGRLGANSLAPKAIEFYQNENFPVYPTPERAVSVMSYLVKYSEVLGKK